VIHTSLGNIFYFLNTTNNRIIFVIRSTLHIFKKQVDLYIDFLLLYPKRCLPLAQSKYTKAAFHASN